MGRLGISYTDVENAAHQLKSKGINPTVDAVRSILGTGSKSTIVPYLKRWRSLQMDSISHLTKPDVPPKFLALAKELYKHFEDDNEAEIKMLKQKLLELKVIAEGARTRLCG